ncbi:MAG: amidase family protein [Defluviitaleaceae bacterium]|nr:amidase family protein [Defluviitaleaceae bacterium]
MVALENSIMVKDRPATAGSKILENFVSPFSAGVVDKLAESGITIADERASACEFGIPNLFEKEDADVRIPADSAICNDIFGVYRKHAAQSGHCYIHPTYGTVSRFGLISLAASMDQAGVFCKDAREGFKLLSAIAGHDERDGAMFPQKSYSYAPSAGAVKIGLPGFAHGLDFAGKLETTAVTLPHFEALKQVMYILFSGEFSNNVSRYDGIKFGFRAEGCRGVNDLYLKTRTQGFGAQTKLAAVTGSMVLSQEKYAPYYEQAMKIRRAVKDGLPFDKCDVIALPATLGGTHYDDMALYALPVLAGLPCLAFSAGGQGVQLIADIHNEQALLAAWEVLA